jgi:peptidoglycan LD-endopeptidase LytH
MRWAIALLSCILTAPLPKLVPPLTNLTVKEVHDTFGDPRSGHAHEAIDLMSPRGTPVHAVARGTIRKLFLSKPGGNTIYQFDESSHYCFYYAHLGYVGFTGDADPSAPHLHFTIFELGSEKQWWKGTAVNPYSALVAAYQSAGGRKQ